MSSDQAMAIVVLVYRPEADPAGEVAHEEEPFAGVEVLGVFANIESANEAIREANGGWKFAIEAVGNELP